MHHHPLQLSSFHALELQIEFGGTCHISGRPYTVFRWRPGNDARYKKTIICQEVAKAKNVCQVCQQLLSSRFKAAPSLQQTLSLTSLNKNTAALCAVTLFGSGVSPCHRQHTRCNCLQFMHVTPTVCSNWQLYRPKHNQRLVCLLA
jgi:hypothetical protein